MIHVNDSIHANRAQAARRCTSATLAETRVYWWTTSFATAPKTSHLMQIPPNICWKPSVPLLESPVTSTGPPSGEQAPSTRAFKLSFKTSHRIPGTRSVRRTSLTMLSLLHPSLISSNTLQKEPSSNIGARRRISTRRLCSQSAQ